MYKNIATQTLHAALLSTGGVEVDVLRLDRIHDKVSGNKWFKLKYHLIEAERDHNIGIISFGGAYSNHLVALAYAALEKGLHSIGVIRGEEPAALNESLADMKAAGMELLFVSREDYRSKESLCKKLADKYPGYYFVPEGGQSDKGIRGAEEILSRDAHSHYTHILCAVGTGTTMAGIVNASSPAQRVIGISTLKAEHETDNVLLNFLRHHCQKENYELRFDYHFGGYAKKTPALLAFMNAFYDTQHIPTDFIYTGKLLFAVYDLVEKNYFSPGSRLLVIHSGGLQGNRSLPPGSLHFGH